MDDIDEKLLNLIQDEIPMDRRPFQILSRKLSIDEVEVIERINKLKEEGIIRRIGGIFNSKKLGYISTLCAARVPYYRIDEVAEYINGYDEVTHNYIREGLYNMWFTIITYSEEKLISILKDIKTNTGLKEIMNLPATKLFKIKVDLNMEEN
ncbi:AsnC family transcriptional regulator [Clostridium tyrobutyricum]|uniref:siroheme decarboxylase subunit alpha n=1 Tax=Clostridium tyrobutyricum TaxID=1519 RepID=UPI001C38E710|nr:AsnC family transcriptional regulator [Clostridium tyrobutyricum]MBV4419526.1 AsnC family transcriptional regulator [Clostridium tyrobutyricum]